MLIFYYSFQYKNAFFSANPDFKWYKLPAPPLRTLNTRPLVKISPMKKTEPSGDEEHEILFTPGKLADETQLGSLTSLINNDNGNIFKTPHASVTETDKKEDITFESYNNRDFLSPINTISLNEPPKPLKKRMLHESKDAKNVVRCIFSTNEEESLDDSIDLSEERNDDSNVTKQELIDKVVDHICSSQETDMCITCSDKESKTKEQRTSVRSCKGLRYAKFMAEGKLLVNKRSKKNYSMAKTIGRIVKDESNQVPRFLPIELNETIKKLAERTSKIPSYDEYDDQNRNDIVDDNIKKMFRAADFNLDAKIEALPSLSLEKFQQKKKESKKKKLFRTTKTNSKLYSDITKKINNNNNDMLIGSKKRKPRKQSITRLDLDSNRADATPAQPEVDLFGLATLAEVAAKKAKIDQ